MQIPNEKAETRQNAERGRYAGRISPLVSFNHVIALHFVAFSSSLYTTICNPKPNPNLNSNPDPDPNPDPNPNANPDPNP